MRLKIDTVSLDLLGQSLLPLELTPKECRVSKQPKKPYCHEKYQGIESLVTYVLVVEAVAYD